MGAGNVSCHRRGFLASSGQTPNLRQGNMVFGFFMDGQQMQVPIIMGILGNNAKNIMAATTGDNRVTNDQPGSLAVSGYATGQIQRLDQQKKLHQTKIWQSLDQTYNQKPCSTTKGSQT